MVSSLADDGGNRHGPDRLGNRHIGEDLGVIGAVGGGHVKSSFLALARIFLGPIIAVFCALATGKTRKFLNFQKPENPGQIRRDLQVVS